MSGPVVPPLEVSDEADGGSVSGRPITILEVTDGTLSISGKTATLTTGGGGSPGTPAKAVQFNSDPAGTFTGSDRLLFESALTLGRLEMSTGATTQQSEIRAMGGRGILLASSDSTGGASAVRNNIILYGEDDTPDGIILSPVSGQNVQLRNGGLSTSGAAEDLILSTYDDEDKAKITLEAGAGGGVVIQTDAAGVTEIQNTTTDQDSILNVLGNNDGTPIINLKNVSKQVRLTCEDDDKLYVRGPTSGERFTFDASSATGGITFPDSTTLVSAEGTAILSTGETGGSKVLTEDGDGTCSWQAGGGGGGIGGSITDNQIAVGATAADDIEGDSDFTFTAATNTLAVSSAWSNTATVKIGAYQDNVQPLAVLAPTSTNNITRLVATFGAGLASGTRAAGFGPKIEFRSGEGEYGGYTSGTIYTADIGAGTTANFDLNLIGAGTGGVVIGSPRFRASHTPSSSSDTGTTGQIAYDSSYIYVCTATDTWARVAIATW